MILSKEEILAKLNRRIETIHVEEFGGDVLFREMSIRERTALFKRVAAAEEDKETQQHLGISLVANSICNEQGDRIFTEDDIATLWDQSDLAMTILAKHAQKVNGMGVQALEEEEKNSETIQKEGSDTN